MEISSLKIQEAYRRISPYILKTRLVNSPEFDELIGANVWLKCENEQKVRAFKARGAFNALLQLNAKELSNGVTTHSSGNHAQAIAFAAKKVGTSATIVMPHNAPRVKIAGVQSQGAEIVFCEPNTEAREAAAQKIVDEQSVVFIHPFDNDEVICGQATVTYEILDELSSVDAIFAPVGGGGLLSGTALAAEYFSEKAKVFGAEPAGAADAIYSFKSGVVQKAAFVKTLADGLQTNLSERTLNFIKNGVKDIFLVPEEEIEITMRLVYNYFGMLIEPSSAVTVAALLLNKSQFTGKKVAVIITGGNVDVDRFEWV